jgi:hypothetical protein
MIFSMSGVGAGVAAAGAVATTAGGAAIVGVD